MSGEACEGCLDNTLYIGGSWCARCTPFLRVYRIYMKAITSFHRHFALYCTQFVRRETLERTNCNTVQFTATLSNTLPCCFTRNLRLARSDTAPTNKSPWTRSAAARQVSNLNTHEWDLVTNKNVWFRPFHVKRTFWRVFFPIQFASSRLFLPARRLVDSLSSLEALKCHMYLCVSGLSLLIWRVFCLHGNR